MVSTFESIMQRIFDSTAMIALVSIIHTILEFIGFRHDQCPSPVVIFQSLLVILLIIAFYYRLRHKLYFLKRTNRLEEELEIAKAQVEYLQDKLHLSKAEDIISAASAASTTTISSSSTTGHKLSKSGRKKEVRIFMDGAFDMMHYGHCNAFRLGKSLGTTLVVGVNSDESIAECKGAPLLKDEERLTMVQSCKFVDEVVPGCPYIMNAKYIDYVIEKYKIDYVIHGDDPCIVDGKDVYAAAKAANKFQSIPRTEGVSTTDIVGRMLLMTKAHHVSSSSSSSTSPPDSDDTATGLQSSSTKKSNLTTDTNKRKKPPTTTTLSNGIQLLGQQSKFLTTSRLLRLFSTGVRAPTKGMRIIYIDGAWDMFHCGHVTMLKAAKQRGDYLIVGIHGDAVVNQVRGCNLPLMNLHERVLGVLACRFVDDVLIDAPYVVTPEMVASLNIAEVVHGSNSDDVGESRTYGKRYEYPRQAGIFKLMDSPTDFNLASILSRIHKNQEAFQAKFERKMSAERKFYNEKYGNSMDSS